MRVVFYSLSTVLLGGLISLIALRAEFAGDEPVVDSILADYSRGMAAIESKIKSQASDLWELREIEFEGAYNFSESELRSLVNLELPRWIWQLSSSEIAARLKRDPLINDARVKKSYFPAKAVISVDEVEPWLVAELEGELWMVSRAGNLVQPLSQIKTGKFVITASKLPRIVGDLSDNKRFRYTLQLLKLVQVAGGFPFEYERVELTTGGGVSVELALGERKPVENVLLKAESFNEAELLLERLKSVLKDLELRGERAKTIDLRFEEQVVVR